MTIKKVNDFILGLISIAVGLYLLLSQSVVEGIMLFKTIPFLAEPRTYVQFLGILLLVFGIPLAICSISLKREREKVNFTIKRETLITVIAIILFVPAYRLLGFLIPTFCLTFGLSLVYGFCEEKQRSPEERMSKKRFWLSRLIYSTAVVGILIFAFTQLLGVTFL